MKNHSKATYYIEKALKIALEIEDKEGEGVAYINLGSNYSSLGKYKEAINIWIKGSLIYLQTQSLTIRNIFNALRNVQQKLGLQRFEQLVTQICTNLDVDYSEYHSILEQGGVFEGIDNSLSQNIQISKVLTTKEQAFITEAVKASRGSTEAIMQITNTMQEILLNPEKQTFGIAIAQILEGQRDLALLTSNLPKNDEKFITAILAQLEQQNG
jgi:tetratricopeptide (TPR) repeat protein